jgi:hypothetical protein
MIIITNTPVGFTIQYRKNSAKKQIGKRRYNGIPYGRILFKR